MYPAYHYAGATVISLQTGLAAGRSLGASPTLARQKDLRDAAYPRLKDGPPSRLFCLAPDGVYPAADLTIGAVGFYPTFSPLPTSFLLGGIFSVALSVGAP